ncbi:MAG TPA: ATP-grasp domain-containing protein [Streptosporangiaceae bacterium]|jgi:biotin carboxylase
MHAMYDQKVRAFEVAKALGLRVSVVGPELPSWAVPYVDQHVKVRTYPASEMAIALDELRRCHRIDPFHAVVTFWDHGVVPAAQVAQALSLPGGNPRAASTARNKAAMRQALAAAGVPCPASARVTGRAELELAAARIGYPAIYKPTGGAGSAAIFRVNGPDQLAAAFAEGERYASPQADQFFAYYPGEFVYEEFVTGREVSVEGVVSRGDIQVAGVSDKLIAHDSYFTEYQNSFPAQIDSVQRQEAISVARQAVAAVGLDGCGFHVEVMLTADGGKVIEVNARLGGNFIASHLVPLAGGDALLEAAFAAALGEPASLGRQPAGGACIRYLIAQRAGTVRRWDGLEAVRRAPGVRELWITKHLGDHVLLPPEAFFDHQLAHVITVGAGTAQAVRRAEEALHLLHCQIG